MLIKVVTWLAMCFHWRVCQLYYPPPRIQMVVLVRKKVFGFGQQQVFVTTINYNFVSL